MAKEKLMKTGEHISKEFMRNRLSELKGDYDFYYCPKTGACIVPKDLMVKLLNSSLSLLTQPKELKEISNKIKILEDE